MRSSPLPATLTSFFRGGQADVARLRTLAPLPDTAAEVCAVARGLGVSAGHLLLSDAATETRLRQLDRDTGALSRYRVLHFATHGLVSGELKGLAEPALVLTPPERATPEDDGLLTASEVAELRLDADWVILSACNTAAGAGADYGGDEALSGLARSFFFAGARSLLVSHWPVRSDAAVELTTRALGPDHKQRHHEPQHRPAACHGEPDRRRENLRSRPSPGLGPLCRRRRRRQRGWEIAAPAENHHRAIG